MGSQDPPVSPALRAPQGLPESQERVLKVCPALRDHQDRPEPQDDPSPVNPEPPVDPVNQALTAPPERKETPERQVLRDHAEPPDPQEPQAPLDFLPPVNPDHLVSPELRDLAESPV